MHSTPHEGSRVNVSQDTQRTLERVRKSLHETMSSKWGAFRPTGKDATASAILKRATSNSRKDGGRKSGGKGTPRPKGDDDDFLKNVVGIVLAYVLYNVMSSLYSDSTGRQKIDFQAFRNDVLARDVVDKVRPVRFLG